MKEHEKLQKKMAISGGDKKADWMKEFGTEH
jgi:hypothetical protein